MLPCDRTPVALTGHLAGSRGGGLCFLKLLSCVLDSKAVFCLESCVNLSFDKLASHWQLIVAVDG